MARGGGCDKLRGVGRLRMRHSSTVDQRGKHSVNQLVQSTTKTGTSANALTNSAAGMPTFRSTSPAPRKK